MEEILQYVANLGFPIALSVYLLVRLESKMEQLTDSIKSLSSAIQNKDF
ncbi:MAG: YvrJ family protein [Tissierellia bacterium]|nr:YvrJ family protein [Tissierellia bacterium]